MKSILSGILWNLACIAVAIILAYYLAEPFRALYCTVAGNCTGGFFGFDLGIVRWLSVVYIFFVIFLLVSISARIKYWWVGIALVPAVIFEGLIDPFHIYFPIVLGVVAWWLGTVANKALQKLVPKFMAKIG